MYQYSNGQICLTDFKQPVEMNLEKSNRCVKEGADYSVEDSAHAFTSTCYAGMLMSPSDYLAFTH